MSKSSLHSKGPRFGRGGRAATTAEFQRVNPRYDPSLGRRQVVPLTLIDASSRATIARDLQVYAGAAHAINQCHAAIIQRYAQQIADSYTAAQAVANYTSTPGLATFGEKTLSERTNSEATFTEQQFKDSSIPSAGTPP